MPLYYITGGSGTGKSTILDELKAKGYEAYDVDEAGPVTAKWHNDSTNYVHPKSSVKQEHRTPEFLAQHSWRVPLQEVEDLAERASDKTIFLGGAIANLDEISDMCKYIFALVVDNNTLEDRLLSRTNNDWGKGAHELQMALDWNRVAVEAHKKKGHIIIDASRPIDHVASEILGHTNAGQ